MRSHTHGKVNSLTCGNFCSERAKSTSKCHRRFPVRGPLELSDRWLQHCSGILCYVREFLFRLLWVTALELAHTPVHGVISNGSQKTQLLELNH
jgi:hypothetical protein